MNSNDDRIEARVRAAFAAELRRAESDLELSPIGLGQRSKDRPPAGGRGRKRRGSVLRAGALTATAALIACVLVGAGLYVAGPRNEAISQKQSPSAGPSEIASPTAATPSATSSIPRYGDGIPKVWQGQPVLRWADALAMRTTARDDTPFLVGVWLNIPTGAFSCPMDPGPDPSAPNSWISRGGCQFSYVSADAGGQPSTQNGVATFRFYKGMLATGPAIMRVHLHDPRATQCGYQEPICDDMIVVDDILWTGDAATAPHPLSVADVIAGTRAASPTSGLLGPSPAVWGCGADVVDGLLLCPPLETGVPYSSPIVGAAVLPSSDAVARALPGAQAGVQGALDPSAVERSEGGSFGSWDYRRLVVDNVVLVVRTQPGTPSASDQEFLTRLMEALKAQETGAAPTN